MKNIPIKYQDRLQYTVDALDSINKTICIAKWKQVTMHLQNGHTHSCHHPATHVIPISEIQKNPSALHNTNFKKSQRHLMLDGQRPSECEYCWKVEDNNNVSDRYYKSSEKWALPYLSEITTHPWDYDTIPTYVEVSFSNVCNFKCSYCSPNISSKWMEEINQFGPYPTSNNFNNLEWIKHENKMPIPEKDNNPYVTAFWEWWPTLYPVLENFRITGGEPLLSKHTFKVLDFIIQQPNKNLTLSINSNLNVPPELFNKFISKLQYIQEHKLVKDISIFTSAESVGSQAEYIRFGMNYNEWLDNLNTLLIKIPKIKIVVMSTYNLLSIPKFKLLLEDILQLRKKFNSKAIENSSAVVLVDIPYLNYPKHQSALIATNELLPYIAEQIEFMEQNAEPTSGKYVPYNGFHAHEIIKLKRIYSMLVSELENPQENLTTYRQDFIKFVNEHDARRNTNFKNTFPELVNLYNAWSEL